MDSDEWDELVGREDESDWHYVSADLTGAEKVRLAAVLAAIFVVLFVIVYAFVSMLWSMTADWWAVVSNG